MPLAPSFSFQVKKNKQTEVVLGGRKGGQVGRTRKKKKQNKNAMEEKMENGKIWFNFTKRIVKNGNKS